ncbi:hypothetical protein [Alloactinosynnema sp. L-07]|nr:hypothetical protein [Alloactinosynnema sp. L-07]
MRTALLRHKWRIFKERKGKVVGDDPTPVVLAHHHGPAGHDRLRPSCR